MKRAVLLVLLVLTVGFLIGCGGGGWKLPSQAPTGIDPLEGDYAIQVEKSEGVWVSVYHVFRVSVKDGKKIITFAVGPYDTYHDFPVKNGTFSYTWGDLLRGNYPTDSFGIAGSFTANNRAEGTIKYAYDGEIRSTRKFVATLR